MKAFSTTKYFIFLFLIVFLSSCSITGRKYMSGYHIEWNHSGSYTTLIHKEILEVKNEQAPLVAMAPHVLKATPVKQIMPSRLLAIAKGAMHTTESNINISVPASVKDIRAITSYHPKDTGSGNSNKAALSLGLGISSLFLPFVFIILGFVILDGSGVYSAFVAYIATTLIIWFLCALIAFIEGVTVLNNPDKYSGKGEATAGVVFSVIALAVASLLIAIGISIVF